MPEEVFGQVVAGILTAAVTFLASWVYSINGRTTKLESHKESWEREKLSLEILLTTKHDALKELLSTRFDHTNQRLDRIERVLNNPSEHNYGESN